MGQQNKGCKLHCRNHQSHHGKNIQAGHLICFEVDGGMKDQVRKYAVGINIKAGKQNGHYNDDKRKSSLSGIKKPAWKRKITIKLYN
jgi:hypothetical protein